jgi:hypothetical protein
MSTYLTPGSYLTGALVTALSYEQTPSFVRNFVARAAVRPIIQRLLKPVVERILENNPDIPLAQPSVQFDLYQRCARALFSAVYVSRGVYLWCFKDEDAEYKKELLRQNKDPEKDFPDPDSTAYVTVPSTFYGRSFCVGYLGWCLADTLDLVLLWRKYGVFQPDLFAHHIIGLVTYGTYVYTDRFLLRAGIPAMITEVLVLCGFWLWWFKATRLAPHLLRIVRYAGLFALLGIRTPIWLGMLRKWWLTKDWRLRKGLPDLTTVFLSAALLSTMRLDLGWIRLYWEGIVKNQ